MTGQMTPFSGRSGNTPISGMRIQTGSARVVGIAAGGYSDVVVTFVEPFASIPIIVSIGTWWGVSVTTYGESTTGVTLRAFSARTTDISGGVLCHWIAVGV